MDRFSFVSICGLLWTSLQAGAATAPLPVFDADFSCINAATASRYVRELNIDAASFGGAELCDAKADGKKLFNDLRLIEEGAFSGSAPNLFIQDFIPVNGYYPWLVSQTRGIERGNDIPWATAYNSWGYFTMQDGWAKLSTLGRVGTMIHEARHTEGYSHTSCEHGPYKDSNVSGCDESVDAAGSHAVEMEYYARVVVQGANFHPVYQSMARLMLLARSNFVFNESPTSAKDILVARTPAGLVTVANGGKANLNWTFPGSESFSLKKTSLGATLLNPPQGAWSIDLDRPDVAPALSDDYSYYKLLKLNPPAGLTDMEEVDSGLRRYLYAIDSQHHIYSYVFGAGGWSPAETLANVARLATTDPLGRTGLFAVFYNSTYCTVKMPALKCDGAAASWPADAKRFVRFQNATLRLGNDGVIYDAKGGPWAELSGTEVLDFAVIPDYEVFN